MNALLRLSVVVLSFASVGGGILTCIPRLSMTAGTLEAFDLASELRRLEAEQVRSVAIQRQDREVFNRLVRKDAVCDDLIAGGMSLREAAAVFESLHCDDNSIVPRFLPEANDNAGWSRYVLKFVRMRVDATTEQGRRTLAQLEIEDATLALEVAANDLN